MQPGDSGCREVLGLRGCEGGVAGPRSGREAVRALLRERVEERGGGEWGVVTVPFLKFRRKDRKLLHISVKVFIGIMDQITRSHYELTYEVKFLKLKGNSFQDFFYDIMELRYPRDFISVRTWGNQGDQKCDGYLTSRGTIFQVYAPNEMRAADAVSKIDEDLHGAKEHWKERMKSWVFLHNSATGLSADVLKKIIDLRALNPAIQIDTWGFPELHEIVFSLEPGQLLSLLGPAPTNATMNNLGYDEIQLVLKQVIVGESLDNVDLTPVSLEKLRFNGMSKDVENLIKAGMRKSYLVQQYFEQCYDPDSGEKNACAFKKRYLDLKSAGLAPNIIFKQLQEFVGGSDRRGPEYESAILAVLAYFFEQCDIYERPS